ncbi:MAG: hypothetical protein GY703_20360 [Gammaproteobacteria bacterium]|nr:hypothetical protein [Gammaproteobacteria bacterium]
MLSPTKYLSLMAFELMIVRQTARLQRFPLWRGLHRDITASVSLHETGEGSPLTLSVEFETPYLRRPVAIDESQIGTGDDGGVLQPGAFRFFDWHSWSHIPGRITWHNERRVTLHGNPIISAEGFSYRVNRLPPGVENIGLRIAEGIPGSIRFTRGDDLVTMGFEPGYWMLEPNEEGYRIVPIHDNDLLLLIVSLSELGSNDATTHGNAQCRLKEWLSSHQVHRSPERRMLDLLRYVRDWGPLGMPLMYQGIINVLENLSVTDRERVLFEFYADHWGIRSNRNGRLLAVRLLDQMGTKSASAALRELLRYARHRVTDPEELNIIQRAARERPGKHDPGNGDSGTASPHPTRSVQPLHTN